MSTRCHIAVYKDEQAAKADKHYVLLYKHSDGYPEGVLPVLEPFLKQFKDVRGMEDMEYLSAWTVWALINDTVEHTLAIKEEGRAGYAPENGMTGHGFGICDGKHGDIEYFYKIYPGVLEVWGANGELFDTITI